MQRCPRPRVGSGDKLIGGDLVSRPRQSTGARTAALRGVGGRLWLLTAILLVVGAGGLAFTLSRRGPSSERLAGSQARTSRGTRRRGCGENGHHHLDTAPGQPRRGRVMRCPGMRMDLVSSGFSSFGPVAARTCATNDPLGSGPGGGHSPAVRDQFGSRLAVYAPAAHRELRHGKRQDRHQVGLSWRRRGVSRRPARGAWRQEGCRCPAADQQQYRALRRTARAQLLSGQIDPWLPLLIVIMAAQRANCCIIVDFLQASRLAADPPASCGGWTWRRPFGRRTSHVRHISAGCGRLSTPSEPSTSLSGSNRSHCVPGRAVLRIGYGAPSPLS